MVAVGVFRFVFGFVVGGGWLVWWRGLVRVMRKRKWVTVVVIEIGFSVWSKVDVF